MIPPWGHGGNVALPEELARRDRERLEQVGNSEVENRAGEVNTCSPAR